MQQKKSGHSSAPNERLMSTPHTCTVTNEKLVETKKKVDPGLIFTANKFAIGDSRSIRNSDPQRDYVGS